MAPHHPPRSAGGARGRPGPQGPRLPGGPPAGRPSPEGPLKHLARLSLATGGAAVLVAPALLLPSLGAGAAEDPLTDDRAEAAAGFLVRSQADDGSIGSYGATADAVTGLVAAGVGRSAVEDAVTFLGTGATEYGRNADGDVVPSATAKLIYGISAGGGDPRDAEGTDLVAQLLSTEDDDGRYAAPTEPFDGNGAFSQALALIALAAPDVDVAPSEDAVRFLLDEQCATGGFQFGQRSDDGAGGRAACDGDDSNSTAYAVMALEAALADLPADSSVREDADTAVADALDRLDSYQDETGGLPFVAGAEADASSTALALQAVVAAGGDPQAGRWEESGGDLLEALVAFQNGCDHTPASGRGSFPGFGGDEDVLATSQTTAALALVALPVEADGDLADTAPVLRCDDSASPGPTASPDGTASPDPTAEPTTSPTTAPSGDPSAEPIARPSPERPVLTPCATPSTFLFDEEELVGCPVTPSMPPATTGGGDVDSADGRGGDVASGSGSAGGSGGAGSSGSGSGGSRGSGSGGTSGGSLPSTGSETATLTLLGGLLVVAGAGAVAAGQARHASAAQAGTRRA